MTCFFLLTIIKIRIPSHFFSMDFKAVLNCSMMTRNQTRLACLYAKEHFGDFVEAVVSSLLSKGRQNLRQLQKHLLAATPPLNQSQLLAFKDLKKIRAALKILLQHSMVK